MRIAISLQTNNGLDSAVAQHFGRCPYFALVEMDGNEVQAIEVIDNPYYAGHQVGEIPQFIHEQQADVMLSGGMGGRAIQIFQQLVPLGESAYAVENRRQEFRRSQKSGAIYK